MSIIQRQYSFKKEKNKAMAKSQVLVETRFTEMLLKIFHLPILNIHLVNNFIGK